MKEKLFFKELSCYARLVTYFGDVIYVTEVVDIDKAFTLGRTAKSEIVPKIYEDYDKAIENLPDITYSESAGHITRGTAKALKQS